MDEEGEVWERRMEREGIGREGSKGRIRGDGLREEVWIKREMCG